MIQIFPIDANDQIIEAQLDGGVFNLGLSWNEEGQLWTLSIRDLNLSYLVSGIAVVPNWPLLSQFRQPSFPVGEIAVYAPHGVRLNRNSFKDGIAYMAYFEVSDFV